MVIIKNILVYDLAASYGGALTVLKNFYQEVLNAPRDITWYFIVSNAELQETENIKVLKFPWTKKSWLHRFYFDHCVAHRLVKKLHIHKVLSLQNMRVPHCGLFQTVYFHQSLAFSPVSFSFLKKEEREYAIRQHVIGYMMKRSLKKADAIIVQTQWMKKAVSDWVPVDDSKIAVIPPQISVQSTEETVHCSGHEFFYPADGGLHKNHDLIIDACVRLEKMQRRDYRVVFTLDKNGNPYCKRLYQRVKENGLNIDFAGFLPKEEVDRRYLSSILVFPSYLETFGLPLLEARVAGTVILASDLPFSHEILDGYGNARFYNAQDPEKLAQYMADCMDGKIVCQKCSMERDANESAQRVIDVLLK